MADGSILTSAQNTDDVSNVEQIWHEWQAARAACALLEEYERWALDLEQAGRTGGRKAFDDERERARAFDHRLSAAREAALAVQGTTPVALACRLHALLISAHPKSYGMVNLEIVIGIIEECAASLPLRMATTILNDVSALKAIFD